MLHRLSSPVSLICLVLLVVAACGGGGNSNSSDDAAAITPTPTPPQLIPIDCSDYTSNQTHHILGAEDDGILMTAWMGSDDTLVSFSSEASGFEFYHSSDPDCDLADITACDHGQMDIVGDAPVTDTAATLNRSGYYVLRNGAKETRLRVDDNVSFSPRTGHQALVFKDKLWVIGGSPSGLGSNEVWSTENGTIWTLETQSAAFPPRILHTVVVHNDKLWLMGGRATDDSSGISRPVLYDDVWSSTDGINWVEETSSAAVKPRYNHAAVSFNGKIIITGGYIEQDFSGDNTNPIWALSDGVNWNKLVDDAPFGPRAEHEMIVHDNKIWVLGGTAHDTWSSPDGVNWTLELEGTGPMVEAPLGGDAQALSYHGKLWSVKDRIVKSSQDGVDWEVVTKTPEFHDLLEHEMVVFKDQMMIVGDSRSSRIWASRDGVHWQKKTTSLPFSIKDDSRLIVFQDKIWLFDSGQVNPSGRNEPVLSSVDGITWVQEANEKFYTYISGSGSTRADNGYELANFNDKLWMLGGWSEPSHSVAVKETWSSLNGTCWTTEKSDSDYPGLGEHHVIQHEDKLWMLGGYAPFKYYAGEHHIWSSSDGVNWTEATNNVPYLARHHAQYVSYDDQIWLIGGYEVPEDSGPGDGTRRNDVWTSANGIDWEEKTASASFPMRQSYDVIVFNNEMLFAGGLPYPQNGSVGLNDVWVSTNGIDWTQKVQHAEFPPGYNFKLLVYHDKLFLYGNNNDVWMTDNGSEWRKGYRYYFHLPE